MAWANPKNLGERRDQFLNPANQNAPVVQLSANKTAVASFESVHFNLSGSSDVDGDPLYYFWRVSGGRFLGWSEDYQTIIWQAPAVGSEESVTVHGYVSDGQGHTTVKSLNILVSPTSNAQGQVEDCPIPEAPQIEDIFVYADGYRVEWEEVEGEDYYLFQEANNIQFNSPRELTFGGNRGHKAVSQSTNGDYFGRLKAVNDCGESAWSPTVSFALNTNHAPSLPNAVTPANGASDVAVSTQVCWQSIHPDAVGMSYRLYLRQSEGENFFGSNLVYEGYSNCYTPSASLDWGSAYMWKVIVLDADGSEVNGEIFRFATVSEQSAPTGSLQINGGAVTADSFLVTLDITGADTESGVQSMAFSNDGVTWSDWIYFNTTHLWDLRDPQFGGAIQGDGQYTVYLKLRDRQGNESTVYSANIEKTEGTPGAVTLKGQSYETLNQAMEAAQSGDTIYLSPGQWNLSREKLFINGVNQNIHLNLKAGVHLVGAGWEKTRLVTSDSGWGIVLQPGAKMTGVTVDNNTGHHAVVPLGDNLIEHSRLIGATNSSGSAGIYLQEDGADPVVIRYSIVKRNGTGIHVNANVPVKIQHSIIVQNETGIRFNQAHPDSQLINSIAAFATQYCNLAGPVAVWDSFATLHNNVFQNGAGSSSCLSLSGSDGNLTDDPKFVDLSNHQYSLQAGSSLVDAGTLVSGLSFVGSAPDVGTYEWESSPSGEIVVNAGHGQARFVVAGIQEYSGSGATWNQSGVPSGLYTLTYFPIEDFQPPASTAAFLPPGGILVFDEVYSADQQGPSGSLQVQLAEFATEYPQVLLRLRVFDAVAGMDENSQMQFSNDGITWSDSETFAEVVRDWDLTRFGGSGVGGEVTVYGRVSDALGNWSEPLSDTIKYLPNRKVLEVPTDYATLGEALSAAGEGDVVWVMPGEYSGGTFVVPPGVRLQGAGPDQTILHAGVRLSADSHLDGFTVDGGFPKVDVSSGPRSIVSNNFILSADRGISLGATGSETVYIRNNVIFYQHDSGNGIFIPNNAGAAVIENNVIAGMQNAIYSDTWHQLVQLRHNIFFNLSYLVWNQDPGPDRPTKLLFEANNEWAIGDLFQWNGGVEDRGVERSYVKNEDPLFVDPVLPNLLLQMASPLWNGGLEDEYYQDHTEGDNTLGIQGGLSFNHRPHGQLQVQLNPVSSQALLDASSSWDAQDLIDKLEVRWDFDGDGNYDTPWSSELSQPLDLAQGSHTIRLQVRDRGYFSSTLEHLELVENRPPGLPEQPTPMDRALDVATSSNLSWQAVDPEGGPLRFDVYLAQVGQAPVKLGSDLSVSQFLLSSLNFEQTYQWQVVARDDQGAETMGPVWDFFTGANPDPDGDGFVGGADNCPEQANPSQVDTDQDGKGDVCDEDDDNDGYSDGDEVYFGTDPIEATSLPQDQDGDGVVDVFQGGVSGTVQIKVTGEYPLDFAISQMHSDPEWWTEAAYQHGVGPGAEAVFEDVRPGLYRLGVCSSAAGSGTCPTGGWMTDNLSLLWKVFANGVELTQMKEDGFGHLHLMVAVLADGRVLDGAEAETICSQGEDWDGDGWNQICDADDDGDGHYDSQDNCPAIANVSQSDADGDGVGNICDEDFVPTPEPPSPEPDLPEADFVFNFEEGTGCLTGEESFGQFQLGPNCSDGPEWSSVSLGGDYALYFDGVDDFLFIDEASELAPGEDSFSVSVWVRPEAIQEILTGIVSHGEGEGAYLFGVEGVQVLLQLGQVSGAQMKNLQWDGESPLRVLGEGEMKLQEWNHLVYVIDRERDELRLYLNGELDQVLMVSLSGSLDATGAFIVGRGDSSFLGQMDELLIFRQALSGSEVESLYGSYGVQVAGNVGTPVDTAGDLGGGGCVLQEQSSKTSFNLYWLLMLALVFISVRKMERTKYDPKNDMG